MNLEYEIICFKNEVTNRGMCMSIYLNKRKEFIHKIDIASKRSSRFISILYFEDMITQQQYIDYKMKIADERKKYKQMLSCY